MTGEGQVRLQLRQPWADRTTHVVFDPVEFLGRLAVLVPRPRVNLILYHGVLGPRAAWRSEVVRRTTSDHGPDAGLTEASTAQACEADTPDAAQRRARGQRWADHLMRRTFAFDVLACPRCGGRLRLIALIEETAVIGRILRHLGVPTETRLFRRRQWDAGLDTRCPLTVWFNSVWVIERLSYGATRAV